MTCFYAENRTGAISDLFQAITKPVVQEVSKSIDASKMIVTLLGGVKSNFLVRIYFDSFK